MTSSASAPNAAASLVLAASTALSDSTAVEYAAEGLKKLCVI